ncbi:GNAT family N-acetyltransferase [Candidatus Viridilinea mediisalina]|nr:GNAT family N-acetyltransferase [Candidatus Viridilinea mediisalina]
MVVVFKDAALPPDYAALTYPGYRELLEMESPPCGPIFGVGYSLFGQPIGLALAAGNVQSAEQQAPAQLLSLLVLEEFRNHGIGSTLLTRLQAELRQAGYDTVTCIYPLHKPSTPTLERLLARQGWQAPQPRLLICRIQGQAVERMLLAPWMHPPPLPTAFTIFPWHNATATELEHLEATLATEPPFDPTLSPFFKPKSYETCNSLGLRYHGNIIGWMLTRRLAPGLICYERLFVMPPFQRTGRAIALLAEAIRRHYDREGDLPLPNRGGVWLTQATNLPMARFIRRRMAPYLTSLTETMEAVCQLLPVRSEE